MRGAALVGARKVVCRYGKLRGTALGYLVLEKSGVSTVNSQQLICSVTPFFVFVVAYNNRAYLSIIYTTYI